MPAHPHHRKSTDAPVASHEEQQVKFSGGLSVVKHQEIPGHVMELMTSSAEQRLARVLMRLAHLDKNGPAVAEIPVLSHQILAEMVGTTRPRINSL